MKYQSGVQQKVRLMNLYFEELKCWFWLFSEFCVVNFKNFLFQMKIECRSLDYFIAHMIGVLVL